MKSVNVNNRLLRDYVNKLQTTIREIREKTIRILRMDYPYLENLKKKIFCNPFNTNVSFP